RVAELDAGEALAGMEHAVERERRRVRLRRSGHRLWCQRDGEGEYDESCEPGHGAGLPGRSLNSALTRMTLIHTPLSAASARRFRAFSRRRNAEDGVIRSLL